MNRDDRQRYEREESRYDRPRTNYNDDYDSNEFDSPRYARYGQGRRREEEREYNQNRDSGRYEEPRGYDYATHDQFGQSHYSPQSEYRSQRYGAGLTPGYYDNPNYESSRYSGAGRRGYEGRASQQGAYGSWTPEYQQQNYRNDPYDQRRADRHQSASYDPYQGGYDSTRQSGGYGDQGSSNFRNYESPYRGQMAGENFPRSGQSNYAQGQYGQGQYDQGQYGQGQSNYGNQGSSGGYPGSTYGHSGWGGTYGQSNFAQGSSGGYGQSTGAQNQYGGYNQGQSNYGQGQYGQGQYGQSNYGQGQYPGGYGQSGGGYTQGQSGGYSQGQYGQGQYGQSGGAATMQRSHTGRGPKGYKRSDERIKEEVCDALMHAGHIDASDIEVTVSEGEVTLKGEVCCRNDRRQVEDIAEGILGVQDVHTQLRIKKNKDDNKGDSANASSTGSQSGGSSTRAEDSSGNANKAGSQKESKFATSGSNR